MKVGRTTWPCSWRAWPGLPGRQSRRRRQDKCRRPASGFPITACANSRPCLRRGRRARLACRSSSTVPCCWQPTSRRSRRSAQNWPRAACFATPIFVSSLKDGTVAGFIESSCEELAPSLLISTTAFASGAEPGAETLFDRIGVPVLQAVVATTRREAWVGGERGLAPADLAMHVVLPELDGRILAGAISFKDVTEIGDGLDYRGQINRPEPDRVGSPSRNVFREFFRSAAIDGAWRAPVTILIPTIPAATGRTGYCRGD